MSSFFFEDTVAFREDTHITGTIEQTWSDIDPEPSEALTTCYVHKDLPAKVRKTWFSEGRLPPGYVIVTFMQPYDGHCLLAEISLSLLDRSLAAGDVVKTAPSDAHSGWNGVIEDKLPSCLQVPAGELTHWHKYCEQDFIIYKNWVGQVKSVYDEVTVRLGNGSVVVVEDPDELEEPYYIPGSKSYELAQRLDRAGFYKNSLRHPSTIGKPQADPGDTYYPGQDIQTKKGNLRRGQWKFGAYDPNLPPRGIVVDVRCIQLEVKWIYPNQYVSSRKQAAQPADLLDADELNSKEIVVYNRSRVPKHGSTDHLPNASHGLDTGFGHRVRFQDVAGAAIKYGFHPLDPEVLPPASKTTELFVKTGPPLSDPSEGLKSRPFDRISRTATQGFDMNVLQVTATSTKVVVRWQDCSHTVEESTELYPYLNIDEHDVWPGDKISFKPDEEQLNGASPSAVRVHKAGVVQSVDAIGRIASIRWYEGAQIDIEAGSEDMATWQSSGLWYGKLGTETSEVPLYDIAAYPAINVNRGDGAIVVPKSNLAATQGLRTSGFFSAGIGRALGFLGIPGTQAPSDDNSLVPRPIVDTEYADMDSEELTWCGEIIDTCLDGEVTVRLGAAAEVRDIKVPPERILIVSLGDVGDASDDTDEGEDDEEDLSDEMSVDDFDTGPDTDEASVDAIDVSVEYDGEKPADADNEGMWTTDEEDDQRTDAAKGKLDGDVPHVKSTISYSTGSTVGRSINFTSYVSMPVQFDLLDGTPTDHHYLSEPLNLPASVLRRIMQENGILQRSLPDGVFVRAWESRLDLLRVLIIGPADTPYEFAPFVFDIHFGPNFPGSPPAAFFHSWTGSLGRCNPNLYEDGKICLSLLGTWDADAKNEAWSPKNSTVLQIIVSLMGLVLVKEPFYNEAGFDVLIGSDDSQVPSRLYTEKVYILSKLFIKTALTNPSCGLEDVIKWLYLTSSEPGPRLLRRVVEDSEALLLEPLTGDAFEGLCNVKTDKNTGTTKLSAGALILLRRNLVWLKDCLEQDEKQT